MYAGATETLSLLPGLPQTTTANAYSQTVVMVENQGDAVENVIDGYLVRRYGKVGNTATDAIPPMIRTIAMDLTAYRVYRAYFPKDSVEQNNWVDKFNEAMALLEQVRDRKLDLANTAGTLLTEILTSAGNNRIASSTEDYHPAFTRGDALGWHLDEEQQAALDANDED